MSRHYLNNREFEKNLTEYKINPTPELQLILWQSFELIAGNVLKKYKMNESDREDGIQDCVIVMADKIVRWDKIRGNAFNYFTTISFNQLRQNWRTLKNYYKLIDNAKDRFRLGLPQDQRNIKRYDKFEQGGRIE